MQASGGDFKMSADSELQLRDTHSLITRKLLTLYHLDLQQREDPPRPAAFTRKGKAGHRAQVRISESVDFNFNFERIQG